MNAGFSNASNHMMILQSTIYSHIGLKQPHQFTHSDKHMYARETENGPLFTNFFYFQHFNPVHKMLIWHLSRFAALSPVQTATAIERRINIATEPGKVDLISI